MKIEKITKDSPIYALQRNPELHKSVQEFGCYFLSILFLRFYYYFASIGNDASSVARVMWPIDIETERKRAVKEGAMDENCYVRNPNWILPPLVSNSALRPINYTGKHEKRAKSKKNEIILGKWKWRHAHFVVMTGEGSGRDDVAFDPLGESQSVRYGTLESTRIYCVTRGKNGRKQQN